MPGTQTSPLRLNVTIDKPSGTLTLDTSSTPIKYNTGTITHLSGTVSISGNLDFTTSATLNTNGNQWIGNGNVNFQAGTFTLNSIFGANNINLGSVGNVAFIGGNGFNARLLTITAARTITLQNTVGYKTNSITRNNGSAITITSNSGTIKALLSVSGLNSYGNINGTRIDSSNGNTVRVSSTSTLTDTINWGYGEGNMMLAILDKLKN
jgi:hypothetical protein